MNSLNYQNPTIRIIDKDQAYRAKRIVAQYNKPIHRQILHFIKQKESINVTDLFIHFRMEQSVMSQHLKLLRKCNFVTWERKGKFVFYSINSEGLEDFQDMSEQVAFPTVKKLLEEGPKTDIAEKAFGVLRAISHDLRLSIIDLIIENESIYVFQIHETLKIEQSIASQQLAILRRAGIVKTDQKGKNVSYSANVKYLNNINEAVHHYFQNFR